TGVGRRGGGGRADHRHSPGAGRGKRQGGAGVLQQHGALLGDGGGDRLVGGGGDGRAGRPGRRVVELVELEHLGQDAADHAVERGRGALPGLHGRLQRRPV